MASVNRERQVLRRMFALANEWARLIACSRVGMVPAEAHRNRVLDAAEQKAYVDSAQALGNSLLEAYQRARSGIRATKRGETPIEPPDPFLLRDAVTILLEYGYRPEECYRLRWEYVQNGKTDNARWRIPLSQRHTCLTGWAPHMDPLTLAYLAGHRDTSITKRYIHPREHTTPAAMDGRETYRVDTKMDTVWSPGLGLLKSFCFKVAHRIILNCVAHFDWTAANLAVFHVDLASYGGVQHHRYLLPAIWARKEKLHATQNIPADEGLAIYDSLPPLRAPAVAATDNARPAPGRPPSSGGGMRVYGKPTPRTSGTGKRSPSQMRYGGARARRRVGVGARIGTGATRKNPASLSA